MGTRESRHRGWHDTGRISLYLIHSYKNYREHHRGVGATTLASRFGHSRQFSLDDEKISVSVFDDKGTDVKGYILHYALGGCVSPGPGGVNTGAMFVYDITRRETWEDCKVMVQEGIAGYSLQHRVKRDAVRKRIMIVGCKCDLVRKREVEYAAVKNYADENGVLFIETSACQRRHQCGLCICQLRCSTFRNSLLSEI